MIIVTGQRSFGCAALKKLNGWFTVGLVVCPDGDRMQVEARNADLPWCDSATFTSRDVPDGTDLIVAAHSHAFISRKALDRTEHGGIGYHPSLLPRHRGRDAVRWTIHMGDPIAGGTVYQLTNNIDAGPIVNQEWIHVGRDWDYHRLWRELFPIGIEQLAEGAVHVIHGGFCAPQNEEFATWEPSWERPPLHRPELPALGGATT